MQIITSCSVFFLLISRLEYSKLAQQYNPIDLGQGVSDDPVPKHITDALIAVAKDTSNILMTQYARLAVDDLINYILYPVAIIKPYLCSLYLLL